MEYVLGTANLGLAYGKALTRTLPGEEQVNAILDEAHICGFATLDTAPAYGLSEERIGRYMARHGKPDLFQISTKTDPELGMNDFDRSETAFATFFASLAKLGLNRVDQLLIHRWSHFGVEDGSVWQCLKQLKKDDRLGRLGASVQSPDQVLEALAAPDVETVQLAYNILDWRYDEPDIAASLLESASRIEIRSVFLQGLLVLSPEAHFPTVKDEYSEKEIRDFLVSAASEFTDGNLVELCLRYAASINWADALVVGADSPQEIDEIADYLSAGPFPEDTMRSLRAMRPRVSACLLDPSTWF